MSEKYVVLEKTDEFEEKKQKGFGRLAFERFVSNLLSVKVWLFFIPLALSVGFLYWAIDLVLETTTLVQQTLSDQSEIVELTRSGMNNIRDMFSSWLKFTGSMIATVIGVREIWKVAKIKEETKDKNRAERERDKRRQ